MTKVTYRRWGLFGLLVPEGKESTTLREGEYGGSYIGRLGTETAAEIHKQETESSLTTSEDF